MTAQIRIFFWLGVMGLMFLTAMVVIIVRTVQAGSAHKKRSEPLSVDEYASRLHGLAETLNESLVSDERAAAAVLFKQAHLLRPRSPRCGCSADPIIGGRRVETSRRTTNEPDRPHTEIL